MQTTQPDWGEGRSGRGNARGDERQDGKLKLFMTDSESPGIVRNCIAGMTETGYLDDILHVPILKRTT